MKRKRRGKEYCVREAILMKSFTKRIPAYNWRKTNSKFIPNVYVHVIFKVYSMLLVNFGCLNQKGIIYGVDNAFTICIHLGNLKQDRKINKLILYHGWCKK